MSTKVEKPKLWTYDELQTLYRIAYNNKLGVRLSKNLNLAEAKRELVE